MFECADQSKASLQSKIKEGVGQLSAAKTEESLCKSAIHLFLLHELFLVHTHSRRQFLGGTFVDKK